MKEITFQIEQDEIDGGYVAKALGHGITTQGETENEIKEMIADAVKCHFDEHDMPSVINLHFVRNEVINI
jgi:predicted RNase H-like HicB family nuclease